MINSDYRYAINVLHQDGTELSLVPVTTIDWEPARQWTRFQGIRRGQMVGDEAEEDLSVGPVWDDKLGEPYLSGFRFTVATEGGRAVATDLPATAYVKELARKASSRLVEQGKLEQGDVFFYVVSAFPREGELRPEPDRPLSVSEIMRPLPLEETPMEPFIADSEAKDLIREDDIPVFIPRSILDEATLLSQDAGANETGGVLIGRLHRDTMVHQDTRVQEVFADVTAQIPARLARSELSRLTFTAEAWAAVRAALDLRQKGEIMLGWWHSHSFLKEQCRDCEKRKNNTCQVTAAFMSTEDCHLQRTVFPKAYSVALVISDGPCSGLTYSLFGWRHGVVAPRGFYISGNGVIEKRPVATKKGGEYVTS